MLNSQVHEQKRAMGKRKGIYVFLAGSVLMGTQVVAQGTEPLVLVTSYGDSESLRYV